MSEQLKFRAWYNDKFHYDIEKHHVEHHSMSGFGGEVWDFSDWLKYAKVQQYTGMKDSKHKEIYEGDIVRFSEPTKLAEDCYMSTLYVFDFYNGSFLRPYIYNSINGGKFSKVGETKLNPVGRAKMEDNAHFDLTKAEVVGNIFETPFEIDL